MGDVREPCFPEQGFWAVIWGGRCLKPAEFLPPQLGPPAFQSLLLTSVPSKRSQVAGCSHPSWEQNRQLRETQSRLRPVPYSFPSVQPGLAKWLPSVRAVKVFYAPSAGGEHRRGPFRGAVREDVEGGQRPRQGLFLFVNIVRTKPPLRPVASSPTLPTPMCEG